MKNVAKLTLLACGGVIAWVWFLFMTLHSIETLNPEFLYSWYVIPLTFTLAIVELVCTFITLGIIAVALKLI